MFQRALSSLFLFIFLLLVGSCQSVPPKEPRFVSPSQPYPVILNPGVSQQVLDKRFFKVSYNSAHRLPNWVFYRLSESDLLVKRASRRDKFFKDQDLALKGVSASDPSDYKGQGYDRGHMAPAEDFSFSQEASDATFVMSNMAPQLPSLNRGVWKVLEENVRRWACGEKQVRIITGPILSQKLPRMPAQISVPDRFFKVVLDETPPRKAVAFIYSQRETAKFPQGAMPVAELQSLLGVEFFPDIEAEERKKIISSVDLRAWASKDCRQIAQKTP